MLLKTLWSTSSSSLMLISSSIPLWGCTISRSWSWSPNMHKRSIFFVLFSKHSGYQFSCFCQFWSSLLVRPLMSSFVSGRSSTYFESVWTQWNAWLFHYKLRSWWQPIFTSLQDPREYLPFLRELRALDKYYQRFRIDDHLKRHESALKNLSLAGAYMLALFIARRLTLRSPRNWIGPERFEEAVDYVEHHRLYESALAIWKGTEQYSVCGWLLCYGGRIINRAL